MSIRKCELLQDPVKDLAYYTDCQIASYSWMAMKKSTAKNELRRQRGICEGMLASCKQHGLDAEELKYLMERFERAKGDDVTLKAA